MKDGIVRLWNRFWYCRIHGHVIKFSSTTDRCYRCGTGARTTEKEK